jgi:hypothetical protein
MYEALQNGTLLNQLDRMDEPSRNRIWELLCRRDPKFEMLFLAYCDSKQLSLLNEGNGELSAFDFMNENPLNNVYCKISMAFQAVNRLTY